MLSISGATGAGAGAALASSALSRASIRRKRRLSPRVLAKAITASRMRSKNRSMGRRPSQSGAGESRDKLIPDRAGRERLRRPRLFDHLVGAEQEGRRNVQAERLGGR